MKSKDEPIVDTLLDSRIAGWEIVSVASSALIAEWIVFASAENARILVTVPVGLAFAFIVVSQRLRGETAGDLGIRFDNFFKAVALLVLPMAGVAIVAITIALIAGARPDFRRWHADRPLVWQLVLSTAWGFVQHYVLQAFMNRRAQIIFGPGVASVLMTAAVFSVLHFPNPVLMVATFIGGLVWAAVYQRAPNLFALALSHAAMSWVLVATLPNSWLNHSRVGFKYFF